MDEVTLKIAEINKVRDRITQYIHDLLVNATCLDDLMTTSDDAVENTVAEFFRDLTGDTESLEAGDHCPGVGCGGRLGQAIEDGTGENQLVCPECGLVWGSDVVEIRPK